MAGTYPQREAKGGRSYLTVAVSNLSPSIVTEDVKHHFNLVKPGCSPKVSPLVSIRSLGVLSTTVTFYHEGDLAQTIRALELQPIKDRENRKSNITVDARFRGVSIVAETSPAPAFDFCFVHGLNGHAYETFATRPPSLHDSCFWPRDILPKFLADRSYFGRFMTFGYNAGIAGDVDPPLKIKETAESLLNHIEASRPPDCERPIYFACHSLGGLVVSQAIVLALTERVITGVLSDYRKTFAPRGCSVFKGILYFGTPFRGSVLADYATPFATALHKNTIHLKQLKRNDPEMEKMLIQFDQICSRQESLVYLYLFFEERPVQKLFLKQMITTFESASGYFTTSDRRRIGIQRDHRMMCRFDGAQDLEFVKKVGPGIQRMLRLTLIDRVMSLQPSMHAKVQQKSHINAYETTILKLHSGGDAELFHSSQRADSTSKISIRELKIPEFNRNISLVREALPGTCDWILSKNLYKEWESSAKDTVLFIEGGQGFGKSVLSKFIVQRLEIRFEGPQTVVVCIFCQHSSNKIAGISLLRQILSQLNARYPGVLEELAQDEISQIGQLLTFDFYWKLLRAFKRKIPVTIFCVIDAIDECIGEEKAGLSSPIEQDVMNFLSFLCQNVGYNLEGDLGVLKFLFTSRPINELTQLTRIYKHLVLEIGDEDVAPSVGVVVDNDVDIYGDLFRLPEETTTFIKTTLKEKSGPMFFWAESVLGTLKRMNITSKEPQRYRELLDNFIPKDLTSAYYEALRTINDDSIVTTKEQEMIRNMIKILIFIEHEIELNDLCHAIAFRTSPKDAQDLKQAIPLDLDNIIEFKCKGLIALGTPRVATDPLTATVSIAHSSLKRFFRQLDPSKWPEMSCKCEEPGNERIAQIFLNLISFVSDSACIHAMESPEIVPGEPPFKLLGLASATWGARVRRCERIETITEQLCKALQSPDSQDWLALRYRSDLETDGSEVPNPSIGTLLAYEDLLTITKLRTYGGFTNAKNSLCSRSITAYVKSLCRINKIKVDFRSVDTQGNSPLFYAAKNGSLAFVIFLVRQRGLTGAMWNKHGETPFFIALQNGHEGVASYLLDSHEAYAETPSASRVSSIQWATFHGFQGILLQILDSGSFSNKDPYRGYTPLYAAVLNDHISITDVLLKRGLDPGVQAHDGTVAIHAAAKRGRVGPFKLLIETGTCLTPLPLSKSGQSPHHLAAQNGHLQILRELYRHQPEVPPDSRGRLPIHYAAIEGHDEVIKYLLAGSYTTCRDDLSYEPIHVLAETSGNLQIMERFLRAGARVDAKAEELDLDLEITIPRPAPSVTPLYLAAAAGNFNLFNLLIEWGADIGTKTSQGRNILHAAATAGNLEIVNMCLQASIDPLAVDSLGCTAFHRAALGGNTDVINTLLEQLRQQDHFDVDLADGQGLTALHYACGSEHADAVSVLLLNGADKFKADATGMDAIFHATGCDSTSILSQLIATSYKPNTKNRYGQTALHCAAQNGNDEAIRILVREGTNVNETSTLGDTALTYATAKGHKKAIEALVEAKADPTIPNRCGKTAIDYAHGHPGLVQLLSPSAKTPHSATTQQERVTLLKDSLRDLLHHEPFQTPRDVRVQREDMRIFADLFRHLGLEEAARILFEASLEKLPGNRFGNAWCKVCDGRIFTGPLHRCWQCFDTTVCDGCYFKQGKGYETKTCPPEHGYFEVASKEWMELAPGLVNKAGERFRDWFADLRKEYG